MGLPLIVLGDKTSHGGAVLEGSMETTIDGKPVARVGDKVSCPIPGHGTCPIVSGDPTWIIDGQPAARHGDTTGCGATLISSQTRVQDFGSGGHPNAANIEAAQAAVAAASNGEARRYDHSFQLADSLTGVPLANQPYRLTGPFGVVEGTSDKDGMTLAVDTHDKPDSVMVELLAIDEVVNG